MMHTLWNFQLLLVSPTIRSNRDRFLQANLKVLTGTHVLIKMTPTMNHHLPPRAELSCADTFLLAVFLVGLIRSASIRSSRVETAINHASSPNSKPLAGLRSPST